MADNVIQAAHLFRREPTPAEERSKFWVWGQEWIDEGILNFQAIVDDVMSSSSEEELRRTLTELRDEIETYPITE